MKSTELSRRATARQREAPRDARTSRAAENVGELGSVIELQQTAGNHAVTSLLGAGAPLDPNTAHEMESKFGEKLDDVRIHESGEAAAMSQSIHARAFTIGNDVVFAAGRFAPNTMPGRTLLAHELAHVIQQRRGGETPRGGVVSPHSNLEQSAQSAGDAVGVGGVATVSGASGVGVAGDFEDDVKKQLGLDKPQKPIVVDPAKSPELYQSLIANQSLASLQLPPAKARPGSAAAPPVVAAAKPALPPGAPKVKPGQEWAVQALAPTGIFDKPVGAIDATQSAAVQKALDPPPPTAEERKKMEDAEWARVPPWMRDSLKKEGIAPSTWNATVNDLGSMSPEQFRFQYGYEETTYTSLRELVSDAYRDPANFTPLPDTIDGKIRRALGIGPKDPVPQGKLDVLAQEEAAMGDSAFNKKYGLTSDDHNALNAWLRHSNRLLARNVDADVMAPDGAIVKESAYESYMLRKRIENFHIPSGTGAVASAVARVFTDDPDIIGAVGATGDLLETGASFAPQRGAFKEMSSGPAYQPGIRDMGNERPAVGGVPPMPTPATGSGGFQAPRSAMPTAAEPRVPARIESATLPVAPEAPAKDAPALALTNAPPVTTPPASTPPANATPGSIPPANVPPLTTKTPATAAATGAPGGGAQATATPAAAAPSKAMRAPPGGGPRAGASATEKTVTPFKQQNPEVFKALRTSAFRSPSASSDDPVSAGRTRANTKPFLDDALAKVSKPDHALHGLVDETAAPDGVKSFDWRRTTRVTKKGNVQTGRFEGNEHGPTVQVGHKDAFASGAPEVFMLEDADMNQTSGQVIESKGGFSSKEAVEVQGVVVELESLQQWERLGVVPSGTAARARKLK